MGRPANKNFVITPHKRRGPIAAEFQTPGPAAINLPGLFGSKYHVYNTLAGRVILFSYDDRCGGNR